MERCKSDLHNKILKQIKNYFFFIIFVVTIISNLFVFYQCVDYCSGPGCPGGGTDPPIPEIPVFDNKLVFNESGIINKNYYVHQILLEIYMSKKLIVYNLHKLYYLHNL